MVQLSRLLLCLSLLIVSTILFFVNTTIKSKSATSFMDRTTEISGKVDTIRTSTAISTMRLDSVRRFHNRNKLTAQEIIDYIYWTNGSSCQLAHDFGGVMMRKPSGFDGQKAVCLDPPVRPPPGDCLVYSFGIGGDWSFEEAMEAYGCRVFAFDPSTGKDNHNHSRRIQFFNIGLDDRDYTTKDGWQMKTLSSIYKMLVPLHGDNKIIDYLKMDIESAEWDVLPQLIASGMLAKVRQLGVEFHFTRDDGTVEDVLSLVNVIKSVEDAGMIRFDSKYNMWIRGTIKSLGGYRGPTCFEIAFYQHLPNNSPISHKPLYSFNKFYTSFI